MDINILQEKQSWGDRAISRKRASEKKKYNKNKMNWETEKINQERERGREIVKKIEVKGTR